MLFSIIILQYVDDFYQSELCRILQMQITYYLEPCLDLLEKSKLRFVSFEQVHEINKTRYLFIFLLFPAQCIGPLGMEHGLIKDEDITASSSFDSGNVGPQHGR